MRVARPSKSAFTLVETMIGTVIAVLIGGIVYTLFNLGMTLYAQNVSLGQTHSNGLEATEKLYLEIAAAEETPTLADDTGAVLTGNGPSAGVRFYHLGSPLTYQVTLPVSALAYSMTVTKTGTQPQPQVGDKFTMADLGLPGRDHGGHERGRHPHFVVWRHDRERFCAEQIQRHRDPQRVERFSASAGGLYLGRQCSAALSARHERGRGRVYRL